MKITDLVCIAGVIGTYALVAHASLCVHIKKMKQAVETEPFALKGVTRREASARILEWEVQRKRLVPTAILFALLLCALDYLYSLTP